MNFDLRASAKEKILLVGHRGSPAGNIPCNTLPAYEAAVLQGADMIEIDVDMSADGELFIFHPGMEHAHLNAPGTDITKMGSADVCKLRFVNTDNTTTQFGLNTLDEVLETFKNRCYINVDKFWEYPKEVSERIRAHGMTEQILVKTRPESGILSLIEEYAPDMQYMAIVNKDGEAIHEELKKRHINYMGQELTFDSDSSPICSDAYLALLRKDGILSWVNTLVYNYRAVLAGGHNDDISITHPEAGWGWCAEKGFDFIQTDWVGMCRDYLEKRGLLYRK